MVRPHFALSTPDNRVERIAQRYTADPLNFRLLKQLWMTPKGMHHVDELAHRLKVTPSVIRRALATLAYDGLVQERHEGDGAVYVVASGLSVHGLVSQLLARETELSAGKTRQV